MVSADNRPLIVECEDEAVVEPPCRNGGLERPTGRPADMADDREDRIPALSGERERQLGGRPRGAKKQTTFISSTPVFCSMCTAPCGKSTVEKSWSESLRPIN